MAFRKRVRNRIALLLLVSVMLLSCRVWTPAPVRSLPPTSSPVPVATEERALADINVTPLPETSVDDPDGAADFPVTIQIHASMEPAGCLTAAQQAALGDAAGMLAYADQMLELKRPLSERLLPVSENWLTGAAQVEPGALSLAVADVQNEFLLQRMLDALQVAGFVAMLRSNPSQGLHILAIPLLSPDSHRLDSASPWSGYIEAYWQSPEMLPAGDPYILPAQKVFPCAWMVEQGFAPAVGEDWSPPVNTDLPDYAAVAAAYLAADTAAADDVARRIDWLQDGREGPSTMCGPLSWSILNDAGVFPPGWGGWLAGAKAFWLASPRANGRPWTLFPEGSYRLYSFDQPLGSFDFREFPLFPGDFLFTYSFKDGFDHMLVVTEVDADGNVYTVTNLVQEVPDQKVTVERVLLLNLYDRKAGIARNQWARDGLNGRTGHDGFDVFRWAWAEKNYLGKPAIHIVQPGDTLDRIAAAWRTPAVQVARYNGIRLDIPLSVGRPLSIPPTDDSQ